MAEVIKGVLQTETVSISIKWKFERFFADCGKVGDYYISQVFPIECGSKVASWSLRVYPKGLKAATNEYIGLFLIFQSSEAVETTVKYKMSIVCKHNNFFRSVEAKTFKGPVENWGWEKFCEQNVIKDTENGALIDDTLTILCEITFCPIAKDFREKIKAYDAILNKIGKGFEDYEKLLESNYFSDVTFNVQGKKMYLHKAILTCRNSVFKAMFEHEMKEKKKSSVDITDVEYEIMNELIRFIYSGKVENIEKIAKDLLIAADKYAVEELKDLCEKTLCDNLTADNAIECLKLTDICDTTHLKTLVITFIVDNYKEIVGKSEFEDLHSSIMCDILRAVAVKK